MLIEEINPISLQSTERGLDDLANMLRPAVRADNAALLVEIETELGGNDATVTPAFNTPEGACDQLLVGVRPVCLRRVEEGAAEFERP